jgi:peptidoglycan hydrolase-like protein with peptidoglycan-binding domain/GH24 family phage-related lysozyme (muramidase)
MILQIGSNGSAVAQLQLTLNQLGHAGHFTLPVGDLNGTGTFGENTEATVKAFQVANGLKADGIAGPLTLDRVDQLRGSIISTTAGPVDPELRGSVIDKLLAIAQAEVGVREVGGNNNGVRVRDYQRATDLRPLSDWPWCAAFISWVIREWLDNSPEARRAMGWKNEEVEAKRPKTAGAFAYIDWARRFEQEILPPTTPPEPGMIAVFDFSHIAFVKAPMAGNKFKSIEGNTNGHGDRDSVSGDGVWEKVRATSLVRKFIRLRFVAGTGEGNFISSAPPAVDSLPNTHGIGGIPREALEFIIDEEGMDQPGKFPGGDSGVTLGHGYDLGAGTESKAEMVEDWKAWLTGAELERLASAVGKTGPAASALCQQFRDIKITTEAADAVFFRATVPKYFQKMISAFPNAEKLPGPAQGALLSLIFNRGTSLKGERRTEMRKIRELLTGEPPYDLKAIARELRAMKKLWEGKGLSGLIARREREARLVESAIR